MTIKKILLVEAPYYQDVSDALREGATVALSEAGFPYDCCAVPGALEIPAAIQFAAEEYAGFVALGCVIRGETSHYDIVAGESARALQDLALKHNLCIGNGILTTENKEQAMERALTNRKNKGADAVYAVLALLALKEKYGIDAK